MNETNSTGELPSYSMKPLPDKDELRIFWTVAVSSALEGQGESWEIFGRMLYHHLAGTYDHIKLRRVDFDEDDND